MTLHSSAMYQVRYRTQNLSNYIFPRQFFLSKTFFNENKI